MTIRKKQNKLDQRTKIIMIIVLIFVVILAFSYINLRQKSKKIAKEQQQVESQLLASYESLYRLAYTYVKNQICNQLGEEYLEQSPLEQGADSLQFLESSTKNDICEIVVTYGISPLTEVLGFRKFRMANRYYGHLWNGYAIPGTENDEEYVYVTEDSEVYHRSRECTHLRLSVRRVEAAEIPKGYHPCEKCMVQKKDAAAPEENGYYICSEGECYHRRRDCPGLKRTVYCIARKDVDGYRECSRCGRI